MLSKEIKTEIIGKFQRKAGDVGSTEVQIALLSARIRDLQGHFSTHKKDKHSRRGLMKMVSQRKKLMGYLQKSDKLKYQQIVGELELRG